MHQSAEVQVTGEAEYADDIAKPVGMLHAALVLSTVPHGKILDIDPAAALATPGVHGFFSAKDVPNNVIGPAVLDEEVFASEYVTCVGHPVGIVVADTQDIALEASRLVRVKYEELPAILNIDEAIAADLYHTWPGFTDHGIEDGDVDAAMAECEAAGRVVEGDASGVARSTSTSSRWSASCVRGQRRPHHHLVHAGAAEAPEAHIVRAEDPVQQGRVQDQAPGGRVWREGNEGGVSQRLRRDTGVPHAQAHLLGADRHIDMAITGQRHAFLGKYKVGYSPEGKILALDMMLYNNAGNSLTCPRPSWTARFFTATARTRSPTCGFTAGAARRTCCPTPRSRCSGGPQGVIFAEMWMDRVARKLGQPAEKIRHVNLYEEGETCHFGQKMESSQLRACWDEAVAKADIDSRRAAADAFNAANKHRKGIAATPVKFGISFTALFMNQAGALVHCYLDGTVLVTHGGVEMGQGLHTKVAQICAAGARHGDRFSVHRRDVHR